MAESPIENVDTKIDNLTNDVINFIKEHKENINLWWSKLIKIEDEKITLKRCWSDKYDNDTTILEIYIENDKVVIKDGDKIFRDPNDILEIWNEFKNLVTSRISDVKQNTIKTMREFFGKK